LAELTQGCETLKNIEMVRTNSNKAARLALILAASNFVIATAFVCTNHFYFDAYSDVPGNRSIVVAAWLWIVWALVLSSIIFLIGVQSGGLHQSVKEKHHFSRSALSASKIIGLSITFLYLCLYIMWVNDHYSIGFHWAIRYSTPTSAWSSLLEIESFDYLTAFGVTLLPAIIVPMFTAGISWALKSGREQQ